MEVFFIRGMGFFFHSSRRILLNSSKLHLFRVAIVVILSQDSIFLLETRHVV